MAVTPPGAEARAAVERAEREPLLGHRARVVIAAVEAAAPLCEHAASELRARVMLRLASAQLVLGDLDAADRALEAAVTQLGDDEAWRFLAGVRACRVAIRRGPTQRAEAEQIIIAAVERELDDRDAVWREVALELALAVGELAIHDDRPEPAALAALRDVARQLADDAAHVDIAFTAHQLLATAALAEGDGRTAAQHLRMVVGIAQRAASPADEVEARLALASILAGGDDVVSREEARASVDHALELAARHSLTELHHAATIAKAGVLAHAGQLAAALDRLLELARGAAAKQDVEQYVAAVGIMAELYARAGDHVSAFRTIAEARYSLAAASGSDTTPMFRPLLARLRDRIGDAKLAKIAADVDKANRLAEHIARASKDPS